MIEAFVFPQETCTLNLKAGANKGEQGRTRANRCEGDSRAEFDRRNNLSGAYGVLFPFSSLYYILSLHHIKYNIHHNHQGKPFLKRRAGRMPRSG
jgi:hypothetical protein